MISFTSKYNHFISVLKCTNL